MQEIDVFLLIGQSNARGTGNPKESVIPNKNSLEALRTGEIINMKTTLEASEGDGCIAPAFSNKYNELTGRKVIFIHFAKDGSRIKNWNHDNNEFLSQCIDIFNNALENIKAKYKINSKYAIWIQGESDAKYGSDLIYYKEQLKGIAFKLYERCGITKTFVSITANWQGYEAESRLIASIQQLACEECIYLEVGSKRALKFSSEDRMRDEVHYDQIGLNILGEDLAKNIYKYNIKGEINIEDTVDLQKEKTYIKKLIELKNREGI